MTKYIERQSGESSTPSCWLRAISSTVQSIAVDQVAPDDVRLTPDVDMTPAALFAGVYYLMDTCEE